MWGRTGKRGRRRSLITERIRERTRLSIAGVWRGNGELYIIIVYTREAQNDNVRRITRVSTATHLYTPLHVAYTCIKRPVPAEGQRSRDSSPGGRGGPAMTGFSIRCISIIVKSILYYTFRQSQTYVDTLHYYCTCYSSAIGLAVN